MVLSVEPFTIMEINFWAIIITASNASYTRFISEQNIMPVVFVLNLPGSELVFPLSVYRQSITASADSKHVY